MGAKIIERGMEVVIHIKDDLVGCNIDIQTNPKVDIEDPCHQKSDALRVLGQFLEVVQEQTFQVNVDKVEKT